MDTEQNDQTKKEKSAVAEREERMLALWREKNIFEKSLTKEAPRGKYVFYDGPPFATGLPHYGHILGSTAKDVVGRYKTMRGYQVPRRWGWDCHGLPIENIVEKDLGISGRKAIEALGVDVFTEHARSKVLTYVNEWEKTVERIGRWVDFNHSYKTMDNTFIESVWWALRELYTKGLIYEGVRVLAYCPRCETPIANSEIAMDNSYKDITDISVYASFELADEPGTYLVAWTTTPWTLPGNVALAVMPSASYTLIEQGEKKYIIATERLGIVKEAYTQIQTYQGSELIGKKYIPVFPYYKEDEVIASNEKIWKVYAGDFVTMDTGTGIVHIAPAFGEDDMALAKKEGLPFIIHVSPTGLFNKEVVDFVGRNVKAKDDHQATDIEIIKWLAGKGALFAKEKIVHSYPHCYRCETPLYYYALPSWFVNIQSVKERFLQTAESMEWIPAHLKHGRFGQIMANAPDWTISRNRYWATPLPIWKSDSGKMQFIGSLDELKGSMKRSYNAYYVMRHGESEGNLSERVSSNIENHDPLTDAGREQARKTAEMLRDKKIDLIVASPFMRTKETAEIVRETLGLPPEALVFDIRLREIDAGEFEGKTWESYHDFVYEMDEHGWFVNQIPGGESLADVRQRVGDALYEIERTHTHKNILIITHGGPAWLTYVLAGEFDPKQEKYHCYKDDKTCVFVPGFRRFANAEVRPLPFFPLPHTKKYDIDFHRPYIDDVVLIDQEGEEYRRIPEVIDCWFESGSMPFAQDHYPFAYAKGGENEIDLWKKHNFPAGFVAEYIAQTRTWFYYSHVLSTVLFDHAPFENVITTGTLLAEDGQKMSKSKGNYPDPWILFHSYGVDALRFYLMGSNLMKGEDTNFSEKTVEDIFRKVVGRLDNVVSFYSLYRDTDIEKDAHLFQPSHLLDKWIIARLNQLIDTVTTGIDAYQIDSAAIPIELFIDDLSTWYLRRSRERIKETNTDAAEAKQTLYYVLKTTAHVIAPLMPFIAEDIYQQLRLDTDPESVHLCMWPSVGTPEEILEERHYIEDMIELRRLVTLGLEARQKAGIKVRQPLGEIQVKNWNLAQAYEEILLDELNVKKLVHVKSLGHDLVLHTTLTEELKREGLAREFMRFVQDTRKQNGLTPGDRIMLTVATDSYGEEVLTEYKQDIVETVGANEITFGIVVNEGVSFDGHPFAITITREA